MSAAATCIREASNWGRIENRHKIDHKNFDERLMMSDIPHVSPKLDTLLRNIKELDERDKKEFGHTFKHFIYSDVKSAYGVKLIAAGLSAAGFTHAYESISSKKKDSKKGQQKSKKTVKSGGDVGDGELSDSKKPKGGLRIRENLSQHKGSVFAALTSTSIFQQPVGVSFRKQILSIFNERPGNSHGEKIRIIVLDSGFREGIDLFDVKYVHVFETLTTAADEKQAVGRATRYCGQRGLKFDNSRGWPLYVFKYETTIPDDLSNHIENTLGEKFAPRVGDLFDLFLRVSNIRPDKITFARELNKAIVFGAVDRSLTKSIHNMKLVEDEIEPLYLQQIFEGGNNNRKTLSNFQSVQKDVRRNYSQFAWPPAKIENGCEAKPSSTGALTFTPTQDFIRHYFTPKARTKGMLLVHGVGVGKTCTAIATASSSFEKEGYTCIYVTKHTLKPDVWKNMFTQTCNVILQDKMKSGLTLPEAQDQQLKLIEKSWMLPMSFRQFSNMLEKKNIKLYNELINRNGTEDPLRKTLIIIDEAHKLFAENVSGSEKANVKVIHRALMKSYTRSQRDSARVLLMTATPYTENPMDFMKLLNLLRSPNKQLADSYSEFSSKYLNKEGKFTKDGWWKFMDQISGYVSYLNREKDARSFAYPIFSEIKTPMSDYEYTSFVKMHSEAVDNLKHLLESKDSSLKGILDNAKGGFEKYSTTIENLKVEYKDCLSKSKKEQKFIVTSAKQRCKEQEKICIGKAKKEHNDALSKAKAIAASDKENCGKDKACKDQVNEIFKSTKGQLKVDLMSAVGACENNLDDCVKNQMQIDSKVDCTGLEEKLKNNKVEALTFKEQVERQLNELSKSISENIYQAKLAKKQLKGLKRDPSQRTKLNACFEKLENKEVRDALLEPVHDLKERLKRTKYTKKDEKVAIPTEFKKMIKKFTL